MGVEAAAASGGMASTTALATSTEAAQFVAPEARAQADEQSLAH
jgi:hypothetical protein